MEEQIINVTVKTSGEKCEMTDNQIKQWYEEKIASLFSAEYGTPEITVTVTRKEK